MRRLALLALALLLTSCGSADPGGACVVEPSPDVDLTIAGSGSVLRLAGGLVDAWAPAQGRTRVWLPESIGSSGAIEALLDQAIEVALLSRPLRPDERAAGVRDIPLARTAVVFAVHQAVPATNLTTADVAALLRGDVSSWPDGTPVVLLLREPGDSGLRVLSEAYPELAIEVDLARDRGRGTVLLSDQAMVQAIASTPGAVGVVVDLGLIHDAGLPVRPVSLDGRSPSAEAVRDGAWPMVKTLRLALRDDAGPAARAFAEHARGDVAEQVRREQGLAAP